MVSVDAASAAGEDGSRSDRIDQLGSESISSADGVVLLLDDRFAVWLRRGWRMVRRSARRQALQTDMMD